MNRDATTITAAHETTGAARMTVDFGMSGFHHRDAEIIVTTRAFHYGRVQFHAKKEVAIVATTTAGAISTTIAATDRKSDGNEHHVKATAATSAKPQSNSRLHGARASLDTA